MLLPASTPSGISALEIAARVRLMRELEPDGGWPVWTERSLLLGAADPYGWLAPAFESATSLKQLAKADVPTLLLQTMPYAMQARLKECAPTEMRTPSGGRCNHVAIR